MLIEQPFMGIKFGGKYHGCIGLFIIFSREGGTVSASKLVSRILAKKPPGKKVFLLGNFTTASSNELACLIGELTDVRYEVIVEVNDVIIEPVITLPTWVIGRIGDAMPIVSRADEFIWIVDFPLLFDLRKGPKINKPVSIVAKTPKAISQCFDIVSTHPSWRYFSETFMLLRKRE